MQQKIVFYSIAFLADIACLVPALFVGIANSILSKFVCVYQGGVKMVLPTS